ncbi:MAG: tetratricopeptide repeat protein [candidate division Zixibacteria bacterium]|nr:tetratricopeptide repeat protein [candidate division Zixibacteria bacterium]
MISLFAGIFVLLFFIPSLNALTQKAISSLVSPVLHLLPRIHVTGGKKKYLWYFILSLPFFIPFWLPRDRTHFLGDGAQIISRMNSGELTVKWAEPLEIFLHLKVFDWAHKLGQMDSATVYAILSCAAGVLFVFLVLLFADFWGKERREKVLIFLILLGMGSSQLFFGYVEHYSFLYVFIFTFIFSSLLYLEGKLRWFFPLATFILASLSHVSALYLLPSLLFLFAVKEEHGKSFPIRKILILGLGLVFVGLILVVYKKYSWTVPPFFVPLSVDRYTAPGYLLFSPPHILDFLNQQLLVSPVGLIMILAPLACMMAPSLLRNKIFQFLLLVSISQLLFNFIMDPGLGASRDWDLFSAVGLGYTILGLFIFLHLFKEKTRFEYLSLILALTVLYSTVPWIILNSSASKSVSRFQNLLEVDVKKSANGHFILIKYFESHGMEEEAEKQNEKYDKMFPELVLTIEGTRLAKTGELERAEQMFLQAERVAPKLAQNHNNLGHLYLKRGDLDKAEAELKKAIQLSPHLSPPYVNLADLYLMRQKYDLALDACKKAIRLKTDYSETYSNAATIYLMRKELSQAEAHYKKALSLDPELTEAYVGLGDIYNRKVLPQEAIGMYQTAVELNPNLAMAHFRLGMTYLSINSKEKAKEELELYLKISPQGKDARQAQEILEKLGQ